MLLLTLRSFNGIRAYQALAGKITREFGVKLPDRQLLNMRGTITSNATSAAFVSPRRIPSGLVSDVGRILKRARITRISPLTN